MSIQTQCGSVVVNNFWTDAFKADEMFGESDVCENNNVIFAEPIFLATIKLRLGINQFCIEVWWTKGNNQITLARRKGHVYIMSRC